MRLITRKVIGEKRETHHFDGWFWIRLVAKRQEILHCPPYEGIGREKAADVRKHGFIRRASSLCVLTYKRADVARPLAVKRCCDSTASAPLFCQTW